MIDWEDTAHWGNRVHEASNGSWVQTEEGCEQ